MPIRSVSPCRTDHDWHLATRLLTDYLTWLGDASGVGDVRSVQGSAGDELTDLRSSFAGRDDRFFLARLGMRVAGTVGVRALGPGVVELVRLYVHPAARGTGLGHLLVDGAIEHAITIGARRLVLDTHRELMPTAFAMYGDFGFVESDETCPIPVDGAVRMELSLSTRDRCAAI